MKRLLAVSQHMIGVMVAGALVVASGGMAAAQEEPGADPAATAPATDAAAANDTPAATTTPAEAPAAEAPPAETPAPEAAPAPPPKAGLTLPKGAINVTVTAEVNVSKSAVGKPLSLAPDISYGVTPELTVALIHSGFSFTGFRGSAGSGLCLTGTSKGCAKVYNNVGLDALYLLMKGPLSLAGEGALAFVSLDPSFLDVKLGAKMKYTAGKLVVGFLPSVFVGVTKRSQGNKGALYAPLTLGVKPMPKLLVALGTGIKGPLDKFGDSWTYSIGALGQYSLSKQMSLGASLIFPKIAGASAIPSAGKGADFRVAQLWFGYTH